MKNILSVYHLVKHYDDVKAVDGITFFIEEGQIFGLLGPNGAGKTTTINVLAQTLEANSGKIDVGGYNLFTQSSEVKRLVGYVPQDLAIYPMLNAYENLRFFGSLYDLPKDELKSRIEHALEIVGLKEAAKRRAGTYSGGMKRRLNIAVGLLNRPRLLILDEPAVGVDPQSRNHILESISKLNKELGISVLYTSHYMEEVQQICSRVAIIDHGKIIADNFLEDLIAKFGSGLITLKMSEGTVKAKKLLADQFSEENLLITDDTLRIKNPNPHRKLPGVLELLSKHELRTQEIEVQRSSLETVFLNLTGRSLRD